MPELVPTVRTKPTSAEFAAALLRAWPEATKKACGVLWSQFALETGAGEHCYGWNLGNIKHVDGDGRDWHALRGVWEIVNGQRIELPPDDPGSWFRSFPSLDEGMKDHLEFLRTKRYAAVWPLVEAGRPEDFAHALKQRGYYTASEQAYARGMRAFFDPFMRSQTVFDVAPPVDGAGLISGELFPVEYGDETWLVSPIYIAPVGIGEAEDLARDLGYELPTPGLVDAIWQQADMKINGWNVADVAHGHDGTPATMNSPVLHAKVAAYIASQITRPYRLLAGAFKDVVQNVNGTVGLYGWHGADGKPVQPFYGGHARAWKDYSQGLRLVRRAS